jgi:creatinine amidohydrolase
MTQSIALEDLCWPDVERLIDEGFRTAVFSVGAIEQHGPHLPLVVDALLGTEIAMRVGHELGDALVAPTIRPGYSPHHMTFAGTITLRHSTLTAIIVDYCTSLADHGFRDLIVISTHGGNTSIVKSASQEGQEAVGKDHDVIAITNVMGYLDDDYDRSREGYHATRMETSCVLQLVPELVHMERARDWSPTIDPRIRDVGALLDRDGVAHFSPDGTLGWPESAKAELGEHGLSSMGRNIAEQVRLVQRHRATLAAANSD